MRWTLLTLLCLTLSAHAETWRWVDENGVVNYSDQPRPGAELIELDTVQTFSPPEWTTRSDPDPAVADEEPAGGGSYSRVSILAPQPEETIRNNAGTLDVALETDPPIQPGDRINLYLDGERVNGLPANASRVTINRVLRGTHTLRATVENARGEELARSDTLQFFVQQTSIQNPVNPVNPPGVGPTPPIARPPVVRPRPQGGG